MILGYEVLFIEGWNCDGVGSEIFGIERVKIFVGDWTEGVFFVGGVKFILLLKLFLNF